MARAEKPRHELRWCGEGGCSRRDYRMPSEMAAVWYRTPALPCATSSGDFRIYIRVAYQPPRTYAHLAQFHFHEHAARVKSFMSRQSDARMPLYARAHACHSCPARFWYLGLPILLRRWALSFKAPMISPHARTPPPPFSQATCRWGRRHGHELCWVSRCFILAMQLSHACFDMPRLFLVTFRISGPPGRIQHRLPHDDDI